MYYGPPVIAFTLQYQKKVLLELQLDFPRNMVSIMKGLIGNKVHTVAGFDTY